MRDRLFRWLFGWCFWPKCDCNLNAGEQKCLRRVDRTAVSTKEKTDVR